MPIVEMTPELQDKFNSQGPQQISLTKSVKKSETSQKDKSPKKDKQ